MGGAGVYVCVVVGGGGLGVHVGGVSVGFVV